MTDIDVDFFFLELLPSSGFYFDKKLRAAQRQRNFPLAKRRKKKWMFIHLEGMRNLLSSWRKIYLLQNFSFILFQTCFTVERFLSRFRRFWILCQLDIVFFFSFRLDIGWLQKMNQDFFFWRKKFYYEICKSSGLNYFFALNFEIFFL